MTRCVQTFDWHYIQFNYESYINPFYSKYCTEHCWSVCLCLSIVLTCSNHHMSGLLIHLGNSDNIKEVVHHLMLSHIGFPVIA